MMLTRVIKLFVAAISYKLLKIMNAYYTCDFSMCRENVCAKWKKQKRFPHGACAQQTAKPFSSIVAHIHISGSGPNSGALWKCAMTKRQLIKVAD